MTRIDQKILFTALSFLSIAIKGQGEKDLSEQVVRLSCLMDAFVTEHVIEPLAFAAPASEATDILIDKHIRELRGHGEMRLPQDKETLIQLYDRLQQRKARRLQRDFYASVRETKLADLILRLLDEEIEDGEVLT